MVAPGESDPAKEVQYFPETLAALEVLRANPSTIFMCIHGIERAVGIYEVYEGCVAFPGVQTQALCGQHDITNGSIDGMDVVVDLSPNAQWSEVRGNRPDFCLMQNPATQELELVPFATRQEHKHSDSI